MLDLSCRKRGDTYYVVSRHARLPLALAAAAAALPPSAMFTTLVQEWQCTLEHRS